MALCLSSLLCGILFGAGLALAQMVNPDKVLGFLDVAGKWDLSLLLVMASALVTLMSAQRAILKRGAPVLEGRFQTPPLKRIDRRLLTGSALFGVGWGLSGLCPGPAISGLVYGYTGGYVFASTMFVGMWLFHTLRHLKGFVREG